jgi:predicted kinase
MATLHLIVGLPCSGKTTYAKKLELEQSALRFTPDEWHTRLFGLDLEHPEHDARHDLIEEIMWDVAARALQLGNNVILDFGFWGKSEREEYRTRAARVGANTVIHFLNVPEEELLARLEVRNANLPAGTFQIPTSKLLEWMQIFQAPSEDELTSSTI